MCVIAYYSYSSNIFTHNGNECHMTIILVMLLCSNTDMDEMKTQNEGVAKSSFS